MVHLGAVKPSVRAGGVALATSWLLFALPAAAQPPTTTTPSTTTTPTGPKTTAPGTTTETVEETLSSGQVPGISMPGVLLPPRIALDFLYAPPARGPLTLTPSITIGEEFNDNIFLSNANKHSDFITQVTPGLALQMQRPGFTLLSAANFTAEKYVDNDELDNAANRMTFLTALRYQVKEGVSLSLTEDFHYDRNTNTTSVIGVSSGRRTSFGNVLAAGLGVELTPRTTWNLTGAYELLRFTGGGAGASDSNIFRVGTGFGYTVTPRLTATVAYDFAYLDIEREPTSFTHALRVGGSYQITRTLTVSASAGPSLLISEGDTTITPAARAELGKAMSWGGIRVFYDRTIGATGGLGGPSDNQVFGGSVSVSTLMRGLYLDFSPRYSMSKTEGPARSNADVDTLTLSLRARYQIARHIAIVGGYTYLRQRGSGGATTGTNTVDVDQNRVNVGIQFGYPINFD